MRKELQYNHATLKAFHSFAIGEGHHQELKWCLEEIEKNLNSDKKNKKNKRLLVFSFGWGIHTIQSLIQNIVKRGRGTMLIDCMKNAINNGDEVVYSTPKKYVYEYASYTFSSFDGAYNYIKPTLEKNKYSLEPYSQGLNEYGNIETRYTNGITITQKLIL